MITQITDKEIAQAAEIEALRQEVTAWSITAENLEAELDRERIRLAACGVVAMSDTPDSAAKARQMLPEYESGSCDDVKRRVDECMALRAERDALAADLDKSIALLAMLFDRFENGVQCYEDPEDCTGFLGHAVNLADDEFRECAEILNRLAPF